MQWGNKKNCQLSNIKSFLWLRGLGKSTSCRNPTGPSRWHNITWNMRTVPTPATANTAHKGTVCEGRTGGGSKRKDGMFQGVSGTLQATGYKRVSIILSKLQECTAWNKHAQITHYSVWYINSHFLTQTKKEKRKKKRTSPPTENGIPSCESQAIYGMRHFPPLKYLLLLFFLPLSLFLDRQ